MIHYNLVTRLHSSKEKTGVQARLLMSKSKTPTRPLLTNDIIVAAMNAKTDTLSKSTTPAPIPGESNDDATITAGTREKRRILEAYEAKFGTGYPDSIITRKKGKLDDTSTLLSHSTRRMRPPKDKFIESIS